MPQLTPEQRSLRARMGAYAAHAKHGRVEMTRAARSASPGTIDYWIRTVDPGLPEAERRTRAEDAKKAYFTGLALKSARARRKAS